MNGWVDGYRFFNNRDIRAYLEGKAGTNGEGLGKMVKAKKIN